MDTQNYFPEPAKKPNIPVPAGMNLVWNHSTGRWAFRPVSGYSTVYLKKDSFIPKRQETNTNTSNVTGKTQKSSLDSAKKAKNDEFYTRLEDITNELKHYKEHFQGKTVYCPCDKAFNLGRSNFVQFFIEHFVDWGIKKLVATQYNEDGRGWKWVVERGDVNGNGYIDESEIDTYQLYGNGDFASDECRQIMKECDIVVTNPPFSLFRQFVAQIMEFGKKFLIIGNMNAITYKEIFPLIKDNKMWLGFTAPKVFEVPLDKVEDEKKQFEEDGKVYQKFGNILWYTNLVHSKRLDGIYCPARYKGREDKYPVYDNYDAIEIGHYTRNGKWEGSLDELPSDYDGYMGVPITFLGQYSPEQFEIVGLLQSSTEEEAGIPILRTYNDFLEMRQDMSFTGASGGKANGNPVITGKPVSGNFLYNKETGEYVHSVYARILIRRKKAN